VAPSDIKLENLSQRVEFLEDKIMDSLEIVKENQEKMGEDISKIKEAMYNPDAGLYARLKIVEESRRNSSRLIWFTFTVLVGSLVGALVKILYS
jgi:fructosamine-3-kinase